MVDKEKIDPGSTEQQPLAEVLDGNDSNEDGAEEGEEEMEQEYD